MDAKKWIAELRSELKKNGNAAHAKQMQAYMKSALPYYGVKLPAARKIFRELSKPLEFASFAQFEKFVRAVYGPATHREERYAALHLLDLKQTRKFQTLEAVPLYQWLITEGSWWDVVDEVATHFFAPLLLADRKATEKVLRSWSHGEHLWLRRTAIIAQTLMHEDTDVEFLFEMIEPAIDEKEFFLRKAIGWALRAASKEFPREIRSYVDRNVDRLSGLSKREAEKGLTRAGH
ncbi:MAG: DNA alkylation repair protein [Archangium sp.]